MSHRIAIAIASAALLAASGCYGKKTVKTAPGPRDGQSLVEPVVTGSFVVPPRSYKQFKVVVEPDTTNARLEGTFSATGANNDIEVLLLEESQYLNWQNRHKFIAVYDSGRVTADRLRTTLPAEPATYFVVFSNRFSLLSQKAIAAEVSMRCDRPKNKRKTSDD